MFKQWRINKLKVKLAGEEARVARLTILVHSGNKIPTYYIDAMINAEYAVAKIKEKISQISTQS